MLFRIYQLLDWCCRWAEKLAVKLGTPLDLPSRLGSAMVQVLSTAVGSGGHTYLPWSMVTQEAERLLQSTGQPTVVHPVAKEPLPIEVVRSVTKIEQSYWVVNGLPLQASCQACITCSGAHTFKANVCGLLPRLLPAKT